VIATVVDGLMKELGLDGSSLGALAAGATHDVDGTVKTSAFAAPVDLSEDQPAATEPAQASDTPTEGTGAKETSDAD
jgi:hypothetical protein